MTTTRINHTGHAHANTTAARTACRKSLGHLAGTVFAPVAPVEVPMFTLGVVGRGKVRHSVLVVDGNVIGVKCGADKGRSDISTWTCEINDVNCHRCR